MPALGRIADAIREAGGALLVTADHGNCEMMRDPETGGPHTAHTTNPVPLLLVGGGDMSLAEAARRLAPTLLELMGCRSRKTLTDDLLRTDGHRRAAPTQMSGHRSA